MIEKLIRFYKYNIKPRYANLYGMELYDYDIDFHSSELGAPYGDYSKGLFREGQFSFDERGVFVFLDKDGGYQYNPCGIAEYALVCYEKIIKEGEEAISYKGKFKSQILWLETHFSKINESMIVWYYDYMGENFYSGISQGMVICAFARAYQYYHDDKYLDLSWCAFRFMNLNVKEGGTRCFDAPYICWYEEYPYSESKVLNGHIYSLLGVYDLYRVTGNSELKKCFYDGVDAVKRNIDKYDLGFYTKYDVITPNPANNSYHYTHITLFRILYMITGDVFFAKYAERFAKNHRSKIDRLKNSIYILKLAIKNSYL